jgi:parallel beta-helix repeat protein
MIAGTEGETWAAVDSLLRCGKSGNPSYNMLVPQEIAMAFFTWLKVLIQPASRCGGVRTGFRPTIESLESREVPSATTSVGSSILQVRQGDPHAQYQSIQAAVNAAHPGDEIDIFSGIYQEAVTVSTPGFSLVGTPGANVVIQNPGTSENGVTVQPAGSQPLAGFTLANVTVSGFTSDGVFLNNVTGFVLDHVNAKGNGEYGLFPVLSANGVIENCKASGSNDTGIYVGLSQSVLVENNAVTDNVNGIEIENSKRVTATHNTVTNNTVGILVDLLPGFPLAQEVSSHNAVSNNLVVANNRPNTASPDDIASAEPPGVGIAIVGGDHTTVQSNVVLGNAYAGIAVLSGNDLLALAQLAGITVPPYPTSVNPDPNNTLVQGNVVLGNGFITTSLPGGFPDPADLIWTGTGQNNHWKNNSFGTSSPGQLP